jgi:hypothetical protein
MNINFQSLNDFLYVLLPFLVKLLFIMLLSAPNGLGVALAVVKLLYVIYDILDAFYTHESPISLPLLNIDLTSIDFYIFLCDGSFFLSSFNV